MAAAYGLYTHIQSNKRRSIALLIGLFFLVYLLTYAGALVAEVLISSAYNPPVNFYLRAAWQDLLKVWPWVTGGTILWIIIAYFFHQQLIDSVTGSEDVTRDQQPRLYNLLENLCISRGITMPKLKLIESDALNAFATGMNEGQYSITVTTGLLGTLNDQEMEAVLGHELTHIRNGDVRMLVVAVIIAGVISFFGELVFRTLFQSNYRWGGDSSGSGWGSSSSSGSGSNNRKGGGAIIVILIALALVALAWFLALVVRFALSRKREFLADAGSVELTKNPDAMISALRKIEGRGELPGSNSAVMEMCIDNPREGFSNIFDTHPSVDARVTALVEFAGGHDPGPINRELPAADAEKDLNQPAEIPGEWQQPWDQATGSPEARPRGGPGGLPRGPWSGPWGSSGSN